MPDCLKHRLHHSMPECPKCEVEYLRVRVKELEDAIRDLARCDYDHGYAEDNHSATCRKCQILNR